MELENGPFQAFTVSSCHPNLSSRQIFQGTIDRNPQMVHLVGNVFPKIGILPQFIGRKSIYDISGLIHQFGKLGIIKDIAVDGALEDLPRRKIRLAA